MSNFTCNECGKDITENEDGSYATECEHWPIERYSDEDFRRLKEFAVLIAELGAD